MDLYAKLVEATSEAATLATIRALQSGALALPQRTPAPHEHDPPIPDDGNESETDLQPFKRMSLCSGGYVT